MMKNINNIRSSTVRYIIAGDSKKTRLPMFRCKDKWVKSVNNCDKYSTIGEAEFVLSQIKTRSIEGIEILAIYEEMCVKRTGKRKDIPNTTSALFMHNGGNIEFVADCEYPSDIMHTMDAQNIIGNYIRENELDIASNAIIVEEIPGSLMKFIYHDNRIYFYIKRLNNAQE